MNVVPRDLRRDANVFGISAVEQLEIFAQFRDALFAEETIVAGR